MVLTPKTAVNLLVGLEAYRAGFPELEHFSLLLRELQDESALSLVLVARDLASRLCGLALKNIKER